MNCVICTLIARDDLANNFSTCNRTETGIHVEIGVSGRAGMSRPDLINTLLSVHFPSGIDLLLDVPIKRITNYSASNP